MTEPICGNSTSAEWICCAHLAVLYSTASLPASHALPHTGPEKSREDDKGEGHSTDPFTAPLDMRQRWQHVSQLEVQQRRQQHSDTCNNFERRFTNRPNGIERIERSGTACRHTCRRIGHHHQSTCSMGCRCCIGGGY